MSARGAVVRGCAVAAALAGACGQSHAVISSVALLNISEFVGASHLHDLGYRGSRAIMANVEGGHVWNEHRTLTHVTTFFNAPVNGGQQHSGQFDVHATWVGQIMGGRHYNSGSRVRNEGIAPDANLWSGSIASRWPNAPFQTNFQYTNDTLYEGYAGPLLTGSGGRTADVVNSSWGGGNEFGTDAHGVFTDSIINQTGKVFVVSAGNSGPTEGSIISPASAWNNISVAALGTDFDPMPYDTIAAFSSRGPGWFLDPVSSTPRPIPGVRAIVDLAAPGQYITAAFYGGTSGSNQGGVASGGFTTFSTFLHGTSFAAPIVAGGATLLCDVAYDRFSADTRSRDGRVIKAVLQNSARKNADWTNGQQTVGGVVQTTQSLDWVSGAGVMDLASAYEQFTGGTTNVPGLGGGVVEPIGWDFGQVAQGTPNDYFITGTLNAGDLMSVSLNWFADGSSNIYTGNLDSLDNLDLQVFEDVAGGPDLLVAQSISIYNNVEHLYFTLPRSGSYYIRVAWAGELFDRFGDANQEFYGLAWSVEVPGPGGVGLIAFAGAAALRRRRR